MERRKIVFGVVGSGWRAECYLQVARLLPDLFEVCGVVTRSEMNQLKIQNKWGLKVYGSVDEMLKEHNPSFCVMAVSKNAASEVLLDLTSRNIAVLAETPPANDLKRLIQLYHHLQPNTKIQVAEQYHLQPMHAARLSLIESGKLGPIQYVQVSISHGYHSVSLIRKMLGITYENAVIRAYRHDIAIIEGPSRLGPPKEERVVKNEHTVALLDFGDKVGCHDFENNQHRSWIRTQRVLAKGVKGEIHNQQVKYLKDYETPIEYELQEKRAGEGENLEGFYLKGILGEGEWVYKNPFIYGRVSDEEIALATSLVKMMDYVEKGISFYSIEEALQDQYLSLMMEEAIGSGQSVKTETQSWAR